MRLPDGTALDAGTKELDARLSDLLGRQVTVSDTPPQDGGVLERAVPEYGGGLPDAARRRAYADETGASVTSGEVAAGTFFNFGQIHLVTTARLRHLRAVPPAGDFDARRLRPNLVLATPGAAGFPQDAWSGWIVRIGQALLRITLPTPRCVVPTLEHGELPADPGIMRAVAREHRIPVLTLRALSCLGGYLDVLEPGEIRVGDTATTVHRTT